VFTVSNRPFSVILSALQDAALPSYLVWLVNHMWPATPVMNKDLIPEITRSFSRDLTIFESFERRIRNETESA
jgi:hypothetical protein